MIVLTLTTALILQVGIAQDPTTTGSWEDAFASSMVDEDSSDLNYTFKENCSAVNAFVAIINPSSMKDTLLSAQALFTPYTYHLESTELILLNDDDNNACFDTSNVTDLNNITLSTNVKNKAVLVWHTDDDDSVCSDESKVAILEVNGAAAVLIANNEDLDYVNELSVDYDFEDKFDFEPSIPARMITQEDGWEIENYIESQTGIFITDNSNGGNAGDSGSPTTTSATDNSTLLIEMSCLNNDYPSIICIVDNDGERWYLDGEYEQEASDVMTYNDHPVFKKEGYLGLVSDLYMYLQDSSEESLGYTVQGGWHWVISYKVGAVGKHNIAGYCNYTTVDPTYCETWLTWDSDSDEVTYELNNDIDVSDAICNISETYVCIESETYSISGLSGTYKRVTDSDRLYLRELTETDLTPGYMHLDTYSYSSGSGRQSVTYYAYYWFVVDGIDDELQAYCYHGYSNVDGILVNPEDCSSTWEVVPDNTEDDDFESDSTLTVTNKQCESDDSTTTSTSTSTTSDDSDNDDICVSGLVLSYGYYEGTYKLSNVTTSSGRHVWYSHHLDENSDEYDAWIYYMGDFDDDYLFWGISDVSPESDDFSVYNVMGYCAAMVDHPADCEGCWYLWDSDGSEYESDCEATVTRGECISSTESPNEQLPTYLCLDMDSRSYSGTYIISSELFENSSDPDAYSGGKLYWSQIIDERGDAKSDDYYLTYDLVYQYWVFADGLDGFERDGIYRCNYDGDNPAYCSAWYDADDGNDEETIVIEEKNCNLTLSPTRAPTVRPTRQPTTNETDSSSDDRCRGRDCSDDSSSDDTSTIDTDTTNDGKGRNSGSTTGSSSSSENGATIGILIALIIVGIILILISFYCYRRKKGYGGFGVEPPDNDDIEMNHRSSNIMLMGQNGMIQGMSAGATNGNKMGTLDEIDHGENQQDNDNNDDNDDNDDNEDDNEDDNGDHLTDGDDLVQPETMTKTGNDDDAADDDVADDGANKEYENGWTSFQ